MVFVSKFDRVVSSRTLWLGLKFYLWNSISTSKLAPSKMCIEKNMIWSLADKSFSMKKLSKTNLSPYPSSKKMRMTMSVHCSFLNEAPVYFCFLRISSKRRVLEIPSRMNVIRKLYATMLSWYSSNQSYMKMIGMKNPRKNKVTKIRTDLCPTMIHLFSLSNCLIAVAVPNTSRLDYHILIASSKTIQA